LMLEAVLGAEDWETGALVLDLVTGCFNRPAAEQPPGTELAGLQLCEVRQAMYGYGCGWRSYGTGKV
jgi:hypothetical protein